jgi:polysaccharide deacetylase family protein (PEP-CTERM system associated)
MPHAPRFQFYPNGDDGLIEIPVTTLDLAGRRMPCGGGGYFRLMPYPVYRWALRRVNHGEGQSGMFYFHPWEIDVDQPRPKGLNFKTRFRHYLNLKKMESRLRSLLNDFHWGRMDDIFLPSRKT